MTQNAKCAECGAALEVGRLTAEHPGGDVHLTTFGCPKCKHFFIQHGALWTWLLRGVVAIILLQTLFFKFTGAEESRYIFETLGMEPWGRFGSGVVELIAAILILVPSTVVIGAGIAAATMAGAIFFHLTQLGIVVADDGGFLFLLALVAFGASLATVWLNRDQVPVVGPRFVR